MRKLLSVMMGDRIAEVLPTMTALALAYANEKPEEFFAWIAENEEEIDGDELMFMKVALDIITKVAVEREVRKEDEERQMSKHGKSRW
jgi:hypothetical protein